jgi:hypothetical protein
MSNPVLKSVIAGAAISRYRFLKFSASDTVVHAAAATDAIVGVSDTAALAAGDRLDAHIGGGPLVLVEFGGAVVRGGPVTSDANGKAVAAAPAAGTNNRIGGFAMESQASGDIGYVEFYPGFMQG